MRWMHKSDVAIVARKALAYGAVRTGPATITWDVSGNCEEPRTVLLAGRPTAMPTAVWRRDWQGATWDPRNWELAPGYKRCVVANRRNSPLYVEIITRCRKCNRCMWKRRQMWIDRAVSEIGSATRTWFGTFTFRPEVHLQAGYRAMRARKVGAIEFSALPADEQLLERHRFLAPEITRWLKRVRKATGVNALRFMLVMEPHKSGLPHYHILLHEQDAARPITKRVLEAQWAQVGLSHWRLVRASEGRDAASYAAKYLTKTNVARVRASIRYGKSSALAIAAA